MSQPTFSKTPKYHEYVHQSCDGVTRIDGDDFQGLCDPMSLWLGVLPQKTRCTHCGEARPLHEFVWSESKESLAAYRQRLRKTIPLVGRVSVYGIRVLLLIGLPVAGFLLGWHWGNLILALGGVLVGAFLAVLAVGAQMLMTSRDWCRYK